MSGVEVVEESNALEVRVTVNPVVVTEIAHDFGVDARVLALDIVEFDTRINLTTTGPSGQPAPAGAENVFVQPAAPTPTVSRYVWVQTEIGAGNALTLWVEDGL